MLGVRRDQYHMNRQDKGNVPISVDSQRGFAHILLILTEWRKNVPICGIIDEMVLPQAHNNHAKHRLSLQIVHLFFAVHIEKSLFCRFHVKH